MRTFARVDTNTLIFRFTISAKREKVEKRSRDLLAAAPSRPRSNATPRSFAYAFAWFSVVADNARTRFNGETGPIPRGEALALVAQLSVGLLFFFFIYHRSSASGRVGITPPRHTFTATGSRDGRVYLNGTVGPSRAELCRAGRTEPVSQESRVRDVGTHFRREYRRESVNQVGRQAGRQADTRIYVGRHAVGWPVVDRSTGCSRILRRERRKVELIGQSPVEISTSIIPRITATRYSKEISRRLPYLVFFSVSLSLFASLRKRHY